MGLPTKDLTATRLRTKKIDCPVKITVKMIAKFPQYKVRNFFYVIHIDYVDIYHI